MAQSTSPPPHWRESRTRRVPPVIGVAGKARKKKEEESWVAALETY